MWKGVERHNADPRAATSVSARPVQQALFGREPEREAIDGLLAAARGGSSGGLVFRGEVGVGKTALLEYAIRAAPDMQVVRVGGVVAEMELPFAALDQLLRPLQAGLDDLPPPQRAALSSAFGLTAGAGFDRFLVGLAVLTLLSNAAEETPLLCAWTTQSRSTSSLPSLLCSSPAGSRPSVSRCCRRRRERWNAVRGTAGPPRRADLRSRRAATRRPRAAQGPGEHCSRERDRGSGGESTGTARVSRRSDAGPTGWTRSAPRPAPDWGSARRRAWCAVSEISLWTHKPCSCSCLRSGAVIRACSGVLPRGSGLPAAR